MNDTVHTEKSVAALLAKAMEASKTLATAKAMHSEAVADHKAAWAAHDAACKALRVGQ